MKKVIYVMNVDWNWIKQRPHFIAEKLNVNCDLCILYQYKYGRRGLQKREDKELHLIPIKVIPKISGIEKLRWINDKIIAYKARKIIKKNKPDCLFLTYPTQVNMIPQNFGGKVYYDCMDNHLAFICNSREKERMAINEKRIIEKSTQVFISSEYLKKEISHRYSIDNNKFVLVRNAYDGNIITPCSVSNNGTSIRLAYIGTISNWFDWNTLIRVLEKKDNVEFHLYGPIDKTVIPNNKRFIYHGVIEHSKLYETIMDMDCLIMPFILNDIIKAVDPVKIYEYINFNKNIIMREYPEVERLKDFVYFYNDELDFISIICELEKKNQIKYEKKQRINFLTQNSWDNRVAQIKRVMEL